MHTIYAIKLVHYCNHTISTLLSTSLVVITDLSRQMDDERQNYGTEKDKLIVVTCTMSQNQ